MWEDRRRTAWKSSSREELAKRHRCLVPAQRVARGVMVQCERARARDEGRARAAIAVLSAAAVAAACVVAGAAGGRAARLARGEHAVELLAHAATQKLAQAAKCDAACRTKAAAVKAQMIALRKEISQDYKRMTHFGDEAGYVPPPRSIKSQVMDGSLLSSDDGPAAPPPFSPNLSSALGKSTHSRGKAFGEANMKKLLEKQEPHGRRKAAHRRTAAAAASSILPAIPSLADTEKKLLRDTPATPSAGSGADVDILHPDLDEAVHVHESGHHDHASHAAGKAKWAKEFAFVHHHGATSGSQRASTRHGASGSGKVQWAKDFAFVRHHAAKAAAHKRLSHRHAVRTRKDAEPAVVRAAMQRALSFAPHMSKTEEAGDKLLGLSRHPRSKPQAHADPLGGKFLSGWFGAA